MKKVLLAVAGLLALVSVAWADPVGGGGCRRDRVWSYGSEEYNLLLHGGETTVITVHGDGDSDLDVFVYDQHGNLIASDTSYGDDCVVWVYPYYTTHFTIVVVNRGGVANDYTICAE